MSRLQKDTQMTLLSRIPVMLLSFLSVVLLTRLLGPEGNGVYTYIFTALNLLLTIVGFQLESSLPYFLSNKQFENKKILSTVTGLAIISVVILCIVLGIFVFLVPGGETLFIPPDQPVLFFFFFLVIAFVIRHFSALLQSMLRGLYLFKFFNSYLILAQLIPVLTYLGLFVLVLSGQTFTLTFLFKTILVAEAAVLITGFFLLVASGQIKLDRDFTSYRKQVLTYSSRNLVSVLGHFFNKRLDVWFVQHMKGSFALGQYGLATQVTNFINEALIPFQQVLLPYLAGSEQSEHKEMVGRVGRLNFFIAIVAAIVIASTSWIFIPLFFGKQFSEAIPATQILAIGIIFISQRLVYTNYFKATNQIKFPIQAAWGGVVITVILDLLLIPRWGIVGASIATVIAYAFTSIFLIIKASAFLGLSFADLFFVKKEDFKWLFSKSKKEIRDEEII